MPSPTLEQAARQYTPPGWWAIVRGTDAASLFTPDFEEICIAPTDFLIRNVIPDGEPYVTITPRWANPDA